MKLYAITLSLQTGKQTFAGKAANAWEAIGRATNKAKELGLKPTGLAQVLSTNESGEKATLW